MSTEQQQLEAGIQALEAQRSLLGDAVVDASVSGLRAKLAALTATPSPLAPPAEAVQTLKQVTILFLDVVGSTTLAQHLDPEAISAVMDDALARGTANVQAHGGRVLQYAGDNILAVFGADESREDDAERALHSGLALLVLGRTLGAEVLAAHGHVDFNVRVGIHTGGVLLGGGVDADSSIRGIAVNIAARMEQTAPAGALRISQDTYAQARGLFEVDAQPALTVKGVDTPIQSYLVLRAKPRTFRIGTRGIEGVATKMIGRDAELEVLQTAFKQLYQQRRLAAVTVVADAGIGKSRLLYEFQAWSEARPERFFLFCGRATPQTRSQAFGLLREMLAWRFQIADDGSVEAARKKMEDGIVPLFLHDDGADLAEGHAHLLGHLIGIEWKDSRHIRGILEDSKQIRNRAFHAAAQLFRRMSASDGSPVVLQLEDLHWADGESLDFLNYLVEVNADVPLLLLAFTRPTLFERRGDRRSTEGLHQRMDLGPLDPCASRELAHELLKKLREIDVTLRELLINSAEGNPFYMEEMVKMLIDQGAIETGESWKVNADRLRVTKVPPTLTGVLQARLDGLPAPEKRTLQQASVIGAVFWDRALAAIDDRAIDHLPALARRELALPRLEATLHGLREFAFRHQVLHQVTYGTVLKRHKREGHARVAHWLASLTMQGSLRAGDFLAAAAEHFERAGETDNAAEFYARAAEHASERMAHEQVLTHVTQALRLLGGPDSSADEVQTELHWRLLSTRERTLTLLGRRDEQMADLDSLAQLANALDDDRRRAEVAMRHSNRAFRMADWATTEAAARNCMDCASRVGDDRLRLRALRLLAAVRVHQGDLETGRRMGLQGVEEARRLGLRDVEAQLLNVMSIAVHSQGDLVGGRDLVAQSVLAARESGDRIGESIALANLGVMWMSLGDLAQARQVLEAGLQLLRANGDRAAEGGTLGALSTLALWGGDATRALALARSAVDITAAALARDMQLTATLHVGQAEAALGRLATSRQAYTEAHTHALESDSPQQHDASAGLARAALAETDTATAVAAVRPVLEHVEAGGTLDGTDSPFLIELSCYEALAAAGDARAVAWLARAHAALMKQAEAITDVALREGFLKNIPHHRDIVAAYAAMDAAAEKR